jgi:hypothetical protein
MTISKLETAKTPLMIAQEEIEKEDSAKAVELLKKKLKEKKIAELALKNIEREIEDLNDRINQGDVY